MVEYKNKLRICLVASAGGHLTQLLGLAESWRGYDTFCVVTSGLIQKQLNKFGKVYIVNECNRRHPWLLIKALCRCAEILLREKPDVVISTGAAVGCIQCFLAKLTGAKIVRVDSITNIEKMSLSGRMVRNIADLFFVQWPELTRKYSNVQFAGTLV